MVLTYISVETGGGGGSHTEALTWLLVSPSTTRGTMALIDALLPLVT